MEVHHGRQENAAAPLHCHGSSSLPDTRIWDELSAIQMVRGKRRDSWYLSATPKVSTGAAHRRRLPAPKLTRHPRLLPPTSDVCFDFWFREDHSVRLLPLLCWQVTGARPPTRISCKTCQPTIAETLIGHRTIDGRQCQIAVIDLSGVVDYAEGWPGWLEGAEGLISASTEHLEVKSSGSARARRGMDVASVQTLFSAPIF